MREGEYEGGKEEEKREEGKHRREEGKKKGNLENREGFPKSDDTMNPKDSLPRGNPIPEQVSQNV